MILELATWLEVRWRSSLIVAVNCRAGVVLALGDTTNAIPMGRGHQVAGSSRYESYQRRKCIPSPKGYHEAKPGKKEDAAVDVDGVKKWDGLGFMAGRVHLWDGVQVGELETHGG